MKIVNYIVNKLEDHLTSNIDKLKKVSHPNGNLRISGKGQLYKIEKDSDGKNKQTYIKKNDINLARRLAQKDYEKSILDHYENIYKMLVPIKSYIDRNEIDKFEKDLHPLRKELIEINEKDYYQLAKEWQSKDHILSNYREEQKTLLTKSGYKVRSRIEFIIANYLTDNNIPFVYEAGLWLNKRGKYVYPDFTLINPITNRPMIIEHFGRMDDENYKKSAERKYYEYQEEGYALGVDFIFTTESDKQDFDTQLIFKTIYNLIIKPSKNPLNLKSDD